MCILSVNSAAFSHRHMQKSIFVRCFFNNFALSLLCSPFPLTHPDCPIKFYIKAAFDFKRISFWLMINRIWSAWCCEAIRCSMFRLQINCFSVGWHCTLSFPYYQTILIKKGVNMSAFPLCYLCTILMSVVSWLPGEQMLKNGIQWNCGVKCRFSATAGLLIPMGAA